MTIYKIMVLEQGELRRQHKDKLFRVREQGAPYPVRGKTPGFKRKLAVRDFRAISPAAPR